MRITYTTSHEFTLSEKDINSAAKKRLWQLVRPGEYLRYNKNDGKVYLKQDDPHWRHGSVSEEIVREATNLDIAVFKVLEKLNEDI